MSSTKVGVNAYIKNLSPLVVYTHCCSHNLNLVISHSCGNDIPEIRNALDKLKAVVLKFEKSPKLEALLTVVVEKSCNANQGKRSVLLGLCKTRWSARHLAYQRFYQHYVYIVEALEVVALKQHLDEYPDFKDWDAKTRGEISSLLESITSFSFIICFLIMYQYLSHLAQPTIQLQGRAVDIIQAYQTINGLKSAYASEREKADEGFSKIYKTAVEMAEAVKTVPSLPRVVARQQHRGNISPRTGEVYYRRNVTIPFLD